MGQARFLNASAGSGKTYRLAYKYVHDVVEQPTRYRHLLAVTFTNKATEEMKRRILQQIDALASGRPSAYLNTLCDDLGLTVDDVRRRAAEARSRILHDYSHFTVLTIDRFFQRVLRAFVRELGLDRDYTVEIETESVLERATDALVERIATDETLRRRMLGLARERIDEGARWDVREAIRSLGRELFREHAAGAPPAGALPDAERLLARAEARAAAARRLLRRAAAEWLEAVAAEGLAPEDFRGGSRSWTQWVVRLAAGELNPCTDALAAVLDQRTEWWAATSPHKEAIRGALPRLEPGLRRLVDTFRPLFRSIRSVDLLREHFRTFLLLGELHREVEAACTGQGTLLLAETGRILHRLIAESDTPFLYEKVGNRFDRYLIDEFQDTSRGEWRNFLPLVRNALSADAGEAVFIVGDIKQSIYRWRGGDWRLLHRDAARQIGTESCCTERLQENFRSLPAIVRFNNEAVGAAVERDNALLNERLARAEADGTLTPTEAAPLVDMLADAYRDHRQTPRREAAWEGCVRITLYDDKEPDTEPPILARIEELLDAGYRPGELMILVRRGVEGEHVARMLLESPSRRGGARRYDVVTRESLILGAAPVVRFVIACLHLAVDERDALQRAVYNTRFAERLPDHPLDEEERAFLEQLRMTGPEEAFEQVVLRYGLDRPSGEEAYLEALHEAILGFCSARIGDLPLFLEWWAERGSRTTIQTGQSDRAIEITTIHRAKGLERPVILVPYFDWKLDPKASTGRLPGILWAETKGTPFESLGRVPLPMKSALAESLFAAEYYRETVLAHVDNVNLMYVAITRAAEELHLFLPAGAVKPTTVGGLLRSAICVEEGTARLGELAGRAECTAATTEICFGTPCPGRATQDEQTPLRSVEGYPTYPVGRRVRLRLPGDRYADPSAPSPRTLGLRLHRLFAEATDAEAVFEALRREERDGLWSEAEASELRRHIDEVLAHPAVGEWFGGAWDEVHCEHDILSPGSGPLRRPDRVMIRGRRAVVVDYKFGMVTEAAHAAQIGRYAELLEGMDYAPVEGWLWYVALGRIERIR